MTSLSLFHETVSVSLEITLKIHEKPQSPAAKVVERRVVCRVFSALIPQTGGRDMANAPVH